MEGKHLIRKQTVEIEFHHSGEGMNLRNRLSDVCKYKLPAAMEKVFDEKVWKGKISRLDKVVIDAGELNAANWEEELVKQVMEQLRECIDGEVLMNVPVKENSIIVMDEKENRFHTLLHFLETGMLPWHASEKTKSELESDVINWIERKEVSFLNEMKNLIHKSESALFRFVNHFSEATVRKLIREFTKKKSLQADWKSFWQAALAVLGFSPLKQVEILLAAELKFVLQSEEETEAEFISLILPQLPAEKKKTLIQWVLNQNRNEETKQPKHPLNKLPAGKKKMLTRQEVKETRHEGTEAQREEPVQHHPSVNDSEVVKNEKEIRQPEKPKASGKIYNEDGFYIQNAGLVLLHPFLAPLFENLGYTEKHTWIDSEVQERAVLLTQFMASGDEEFAEFDLMLNKILCGSEIEEPLPVNTVLSDFEKEEATDVLRSVIKHWQALKNTSVAGLQSTFLMRDGKITGDETRYLLQVDQKSVDVLMNRLPWGFGTIKLPWMQRLLNVEWT